MKDKKKKKTGAQTGGLKRIGPGIYEFDPVLYPRKLWVAVGDRFNELDELFDGVSELNEASAAETQNVLKTGKKPLGGILVWFEDMEAISDTEYITHESLHVASEIYDFIGAVHENHNQEPFAYLIGWVGGCIGKVRDAQLKKGKDKDYED